MSRSGPLTTLALVAIATAPLMAQFPVAAPVDPKPAWPAKGVEVVVRGKAPSTPVALEVRTEVVGRGKTARLAHTDLQTAVAKAREAMARLKTATISIDRTVLEPPAARTDEQVQVVGGGIIVQGGFGGGRPAPPRFTARQTWVIRHDYLAKATPQDRLEVLTVILNALREAKLPIGSAPDPMNPWGNVNAFIRLIPGGPGPGATELIEDAPPPPIRFIGNVAEAEARATADALAKAAALANRLARAAGRNIGKPESVKVLSSLPPAANLSRTSDHTVELKVVFALR